MRVVERNKFAWATTAAIALVLALLTATPPTTDASRIPPVDEPRALALIDDGDAPLVLAFGVEGCALCRGMIKVLRGVAREAPPDVRFAEVDLDACDGLRDRYGIRGVPYVLVFDGGRLVHRGGGIDDTTELRRILNR